jgi:hypothetical protein
MPKNKKMIKSNNLKNRLWKTIFEAAGAPPIFITDSETQREARCVSEILEKIGGKRRLAAEKIRLPKSIRVNITGMTILFTFIGP